MHTRNNCDLSMFQPMLLRFMELAHPFVRLDTKSLAELDAISTWQHILYTHQLTHSSSRMPLLLLFVKAHLRHPHLAVGIPISPAVANINARKWDV